MSVDTERQVININKVLVHCLEFQNLLAPIEKDSSLFKHKLKQKLRSVEVECEKILGSWVDKKSTDSEHELKIKDIVDGNLRNFYQLFEMITNLSAEHINEVQLHLIDNYYSKEEYRDKREFIDFLPEISYKE